MADAWYMLTKHRAWPFAGGVENQPAHFLDVVRVFDSEQLRWTEIQRDRAKKKAERKRR